ncbi:dihydrofolate reductase [Kribbella amoyensis]|uniref:Dihydrofolate reductase n=1 Tax=Kribbella amoyensis TaxID=996641 RepID=A0A561C0W3_9ACTN|nr:dihydrofolate reductase family protein [Kribbella amoyensis]TWD84687.1 dihydrofolate reductase [Kribbella amoyensis]
MPRVVANMSMSLDGFVADPSDGVGHVFAWQAAGTVPIRLPDGTEQGLVSAASSAHIGKLWEEVKVLVVGRRTFDLSKAWQGEPPLGLPTVVVAHQVPEDWANDGKPFTFVTDGVESAIDRAKALAGDGVIAVSGADLTQQCLNAGLLDELSIDVASVLLGAGIRYLDKLTDTPVKLDGPEVVAGDGVTHLTYQVSALTDQPKLGG